MQEVRCNLLHQRSCKIIYIIICTKGEVVEDVAAIHTPGDKLLRKRMWKRRADRKEAL